MRKYQSYKIQEENNMKNKTAKILLAALTAATLTSMPVMAADASDYILLLPKTEGVTYEMAQDHVADQYSNDQYTVLLYKEGETVDLTVSGATDFVIKMPWILIQLIMQPVRQTEKYPLRCRQKTSA